MEDKIPLNNSLTKLLKGKGYAVDQAFDGEQALSMIDGKYYDLVILDLTLPKVDGLDVIAKLRQSEVETSILVLTARSTVEQVVTGLRQGADDYLAKPFELDELVARVEALLRRGQGVKSPVITVGDLTLDPSSGQVQRQGKNINLTRTEFRLLHYLARKHKWIVTKEELLTHVWQNETEVYDRVVDTYICFLRRKIDKAFPGAPDLIHTVKTRGYRLGIEHA